jgi:hypothetical protein
MAEVRTVSFKWILIGAGAIVGVHFLMHPALALPLGGFLLETVGLSRTVAIYAYQGILAVVAYLVGGFLVGWLSPGETLKEPAVAGVIAAVVINGVEYAIWPEEFGVIAALFGVVVGFGTALAGAWVGEKVQGDTTEKMRERGELPPT